MPATITVLDSTGATQTVSTLDKLTLQLPTALGVGTSTTSMGVVEPDSLAVAGSQVAVATLFTQDMTGFESISVQVTSPGVATIAYETSDDNVNYVATAGITSAAAGASLPVTTSGSAILLVFPKRGKFFRARVSAYTSGTVTVAGNLHKNPAPMSTRVSVDGALSQGSTLGGGVQALLAGYSTNPAPISNALAVRQIGTVLGVSVGKPYSIPEADWAFAAGASGIVNTTVAVTLVAAGAAGVKNYITSFNIMWDTLGAATEVVIRNGAAGAVLWRGKLTTAAGMFAVALPTPLQSSAATLFEFATLTATVTGGVYVNAQGYAAAD